MSNVMDRKVVEMQFDNAQFERGVRTSMSTLDKLKESLKFEGVEKGFDGIEKRSGKLDFSKMREGIEAVSYKFSVLESVALGALMRIGERAADAGVKLVKSMSVDNITAGWSKFEEKTKSVGTLIAQGYDMSLVNDQLEKLNFFTDETSYSFTNMVAEIAKFTATGKGLEDSVTAMMGIANWAAMSGQNASTASRAMFQLSQAMGSGVMRKEDYKSIQNVSMDTKEFRQRALDAGEALGTLKKNADGTYQSLVKGAKSSKFTISQFADHLTQDAWFTSDVMMKVYSEYAYAVDEVRNYMIENGVDTASEAMRQLAEINKTETNETKKALMDFGLKALKAAQEARSWGDTVESVREAVASGFAKTFEIIFGQYDEAVDLWTDLAERLYEAFATPLNNFNDILETALKKHDPYINEYFKSLTEGEDLVIQRATEAAKKFGYSSKEAQDYILGLAHGNDRLAASISNYIKLFKLAGEGDAIAGASADQLIKKTAEITGATEEQISAIKAVGDEYGYTSGKFISAMEKTFGKGKAGTFEMATDLLAISKGLDVIEAKDLDSYLENTLKFTKDQVTELHRLSKEYGANSEQVDNYIKSLQNFTNFKFGNRGWTRTAIKGLLEITDGIANAELSHNTGDIVSFISNMTGASEENVKILQDLLATQKELESQKEELDSATIKDTEAIEENEKAIKENRDEVEKWLDEITGGDEVLKNQIVDLLGLNDALDSMTGYRNLLEAFNNAWEYLSGILNTIKQAFNDVFGTLSSGAIYSFTERIKKASENLKLTDEKAEKLRKTFKGIFSIFKLLGQIIKPILIPFKTFFETLFEGNLSLFDATATIGDFITNLANSGAVGRKATEIFTNIGNSLKPIAKSLKEIFSLDRIRETFTKAGGGIKGAVSVIVESLKLLSDGLLTFFSDLTGLDIDELKQRIVGFFDSVQEKVSNFVAPDRSKAITFKSFFESFKNGMKNFSDAIVAIKESGTVAFIKDVLSSGLQALAGAIKDLDLDKMIAIGKVIAGIYLAHTLKWLVAIPSDLAEAVNYNSVWHKFARVLKAFGICMLLLSAAMYIIAQIPKDNALRSFEIVSLLIWEMAAIMKLFEYTTTKKGGIIKKTVTPALFMLSFAIAIKRIAKAMVMITNDIPADRLDEVANVMYTIMGLIALIIGINGLATNLNGGKGLISSSILLIVMAVALSKISKSLGQLAASATVGQLVVAGIIVEKIGVALTYMELAAAIMSRSSWPTNSIATSQVIISLAIAIAIIAAALGFMASSATVEQLSAAGDVLMKISYSLGILMGVVAIVNKFSKVEPTKIIKLGEIATFLLALGVVLGVMAGVIWVISKSVNADNLKAVIITLAVVTVCIGLLYSVAELLGDRKAPGIINYERIGMLAALAAGIALIVASISLLKDMLPERILAAAGAIVSVVVAMGIVMTLLSLMEPWKLTMVAQALLAASLSVAILAGGLLLFIQVLGEFSHFTNEEFKTAAIRMLVVCGLLAAAGIGLGIAAAGLAAFGLATLILAPGLLLAAVAMDLFSIAFERFGRTIDKYGTGFTYALTPMLDNLLASSKKFASFVIDFIIGIGEAAVDQMPRLRAMLFKLIENVMAIAVDGLQASVGPMVEGLIPILLEVLDKLIEKGPELVDKIVSFIIMVLESIKPRARELEEKLLDVLIELINGLANKSGELINALVNLVQVLIDSFIDAIINMLDSFDIEDINELKDAFLKLLDITAVLAEISLVAPFAIAGVISLGAIAALMLTMLAAFGAISRIPGLSDILADGGELLATIGSAIGKFLGGFVGGALETLSASLPVIGTNLSSFAENAETFIKLMKTVDSSVLDGALTMAEVIAAFSVASLIDAVTVLLGSDLGWDILGEQMAAIGSAMSVFSESTSSVDTNRMADLLPCAKSMADIIALFGVTTFVSAVSTLLTGGIAWAMLEDSVSSIGKAMTTFSNETKGIDANHFSTVADASEKLSDMITRISNSKSAFKWLTDKVIGKDDMGDFGRALGAFAEGICDFAEKSKGLGDKSEDVNGAIDVANKALAFSKELNGDGSLWDAVVTLVQDASFANFGKALKDFIAGIKDFADGCPSVADLGPDIDRAKPYIDMVLDIFKDLVGDKSIIKAIAVGLGAGAMAEFGGNLEYFIGGIQKYAIGCLLLTVPLIEAMDRAKQPIKDVIEVFQDLVGDKSIIKAIAAGLGAGAMAEFGTNLEDFIGGIQKYAIGCLLLTPPLIEAIGRAKQPIKDIFDTFRDLVGDKSIIDSISVGLGSGAFSEFGSSLTAFANSLKEYSDSLSEVNFGLIARGNQAAKGLSSVSDVLNNTTIRSDLPSLASASISSFIESFDLSRDRVSESIERFLDSAITQVRSKYTPFFMAGSYLIQGFVKGMRSQLKPVRDTAGKVGQEALDELTHVTWINSPSKKTDEYGRYFGQGFVNGMSEYVDVAGTTAADVGESALDGLQKSLNDPFGTDGFDNTITIKPVIDLSEIQNGTSEIDRMLGGLNGYAINGSLSLSRSAADSMSGRGNGYEVNGFDKVTKAVENLGDKLEKPVEQHNNFNFYGATNDEIIREVKKTLTRDIIKEGRKWA